MYRRILVAIDASDYSARVVPTAVEIARRFQSEVTVLHVAEHDHGRSVVYSTESVADGARLISDAVKLFDDAGLVVNGAVHDVAVGHVAKDIVETASGLNAELIVMGSRGLSDVQGILLGSITHKVMHLTEISVLVARGPIPVKAAVTRPAMVAQLAPAI
jgi:nucleotide-binding universal stress UspA family protein